MPKKRAGAQDSPAPEMSALLSRLEKWLARYRRPFLKGLRHGGSPAEVEQRVKGGGGPPAAGPQGLVAVHNGQSDDCLSRFEQDWILLSGERIADAKHDLDANETDGGWKPAWVPFLDDD